MTRRRGHGEGTIFRRGDRWAGAITLGVDGRGRQRRRYVYGSSQREVRSRLDALKRRVDDGIVVGTRRGMTVGQYLDAWVSGTIAEQVAAQLSLTAGVRISAMPLWVHAGVA